MVYAKEVARSMLSIVILFSAVIQTSNGRLDLIWKETISLWLIEQNVLDKMTHECSKEKIHLPQIAPKLLYLLVVLKL